MRSNRLAIPFLFLAVTAVAGCASTGNTSQRVSGDVITAEHLEGMENLTVFQALQQLKPIWVRSPRFSRMQIYQDGIRMGRRSVLRNIQIKNIKEIRFLDARQATTEFGTGHGNGALVLKSQ